jgi:hypothetical protein
VTAKHQQIEAKRSNLVLLLFASICFYLLLIAFIASSVIKKATIEFLAVLNFFTNVAATSMVKERQRRYGRVPRVNNLHIFTQSLLLASKGY